MNRLFSKEEKMAMKRCSALVAIREMQSKTTITFTRTAKIKDDNKCWQVCTETGAVTRARGNVKCAATPETVWQVLKQLKLLQDPAIPVQDIHSRELKTDVHTKTYTWVSTAGIRVHSHSGPKEETSQTPTKWWLTSRGVTTAQCDSATGMKHWYRVRYDEPWEGYEKQKRPVTGDRTG